MPAKKKASARETLAWVSKALEFTLHELAEKKEQLAEANELLKSGQETLREHAGVVVELTEALRMKDLVIWNLEGTIREEAAEGEWWRGEAENLRSELLALIRDEARRAKPVVDPPSDDVKDIEALQDLALRGGVA